MGNSSTAHLSSSLLYSCVGDANLSRNSVTPEYWDTSSINNDYKNSGLAIAIILLVCSLIGLPANAIIIVTIILRRLYKETTHILLVNLAISDFLVCLLVMPQTIVSGFAGGYVFGSSDYVRCQVCQMGLIMTNLTLFSVYILGLMSVDRFIFIKFPLNYERYITVPRVIASVVLAWVLSISVAVLPFSGFGEIRYAHVLSACFSSFVGRSFIYMMFIVMLALIPVTVIIITNIWISCIVCKQIREVYRVRKTLSSSEERRAQHEQMRKRIVKKKNAKQLKLIRVFGAILIATFVVWLPFVLNVVVVLTVDLSKVPLGWYVFIYICINLHAVLHPLIEGCLIPEIKLTFMKVLGISLCLKVCKKEDSLSEDNSKSCVLIGSFLDICSTAMIKDSEE